MRLEPVVEMKESMIAYQTERHLDNERAQKRVFIEDADELGGFKGF